MYRIIKAADQKRFGISKINTKAKLLIIFTQQDSSGEYCTNIIHISENEHEALKLIKITKQLNEEFNKRQEDLDKKKRKN